MTTKRVLFVGDIHGRGDWKDLILNAFTNFEHVVLLGDYVDSFNVRPIVQKQNLLAIISFIRKKANGRVTALLGNHDYAYIRGHSSISGYQPALYPDFKKIFDDNADIFQVAWGHTSDNGKYTLATHAGLTETFWNNYVLPELKEGGFVYRVTNGNIPTEIHEILNYLKDKDELMWKVGMMRGGMGTPGPLWADILELKEDPYLDINQIVGHTAYYTPTISMRPNNTFIARIDSRDNLKVASITFSL